MIRKVITIFVMASLLLTTAACTTNTNNEENQNISSSENGAAPTKYPMFEVDDGESTTKVSETDHENTNESQPEETTENKDISEIPEKDEEQTKEKTERIITIVDENDESISSIDMDSLDDWSWMAYSIACVMFPSTKPLTESNVYEITTEDEYGAYITENSDIWSIKDDSWTISKEKFSYGHDWFFNIVWTGKDNIRYYVVEDPNMDLNHVLDVDKDRVFYDENNKTVYMFLINDFEYAEYVSLTNSKLADSLAEKTVSNRMLLSLELSYENELPVNKVVLVRTTDNTTSE